MARTRVRSMDDYIARQPEPVQAILQQVRGALRRALPGAEETISYQIPAYEVGGRVVIYFAGWKGHYSVYPATSAVVGDLADDLAAYQVSKGTIRFPLDRPVPVRLIARIAKLRAREEADRPARGARRARSAPSKTPGVAGDTKKSHSKRAESPSELIDARIEDLGDWRGEMLSRLRALIKEAVPGVTEEWKWRGTPAWSHNGLICTGETYKQIVKMTFAKGASLKDPSGLFNSSLEGNVRRAIDFHEGDALDEKALRALVQAAVALNRSSSRG